MVFLVPFFAFTFIFNRSMNLSGGPGCGVLVYVTCLVCLCWLFWSGVRGELVGVLSAIKKAP